ncbi:unnamed protein product, partial [Dracunculus medinensis]|uniref:Neur_chan_LBD domain-containing protein n=1 Tax=Dracunculus medinensis TaxID=318479 RepID=A0A0N4U352_DRAME
IFIKFFSLPILWSQSTKIRHSRRIGFEGQIVSKLLADYDPFTRPPVRGTAEHSSIIVILSIFIDRIIWHNHHAEVNLYLRQQWEDGRLVYEVDSREEIDEVVIPANKRIWTPDTYFSNADDKRYSERRRIVVEPTGFIRSSEMRTVTVPFEYGDKFPLDNARKLKLRISNNYPIEDIVYLWANSPPVIVPVEVSSELQEDEFRFQSAVADDCVGNYTVGVYSCIDVVVTFGGSSSQALIGLFLPSVFLIFMSWLHFWIHGSWSVPRTVSAAVPFLIFIFYPQPYLATKGIGAIQTWLIFCILITFASFVEYFVVICAGIRRTIRYKEERQNDESPLTAVIETSYDSKCANFQYRNGFDMLSRFAFPLIFLVFLIIYFVIYFI